MTVTVSEPSCGVYAVSIVSADGTISLPFMPTPVPTPDAHVDAFNGYSFIGESGDTCYLVVLGDIIKKASMNTSYGCSSQLFSECAGPFLAHECNNEVVTVIGSYVATHSRFVQYFDYGSCPEGSTFA